MLIPIAAKTNFYFLFACRFLTGFFHGPVFPSLGTVWSNWAPTAERSRMLGISISGIQIGNIIALPLGGYKDKIVYFLSYRLLINFNLTVTFVFMDLMAGGLQYSIFMALLALYPRWYSFYLFLKLQMNKS